MKETLILDADEFARGESRSMQDDEFNDDHLGPSKQAQAESFKEMLDAEEIDKDTYDLLMANL